MSACVCVKNNKKQKISICMCISESEYDISNAKIIEIYRFVQEALEVCAPSSREGNGVRLAARGETTEGGTSA